MGFGDGRRAAIGAFEFSLGYAAVVVVSMCPQPGAAQDFLDEFAIVKAGLTGDDGQWT